MFRYIASFFSMIFSWFRSLDEETKKKIISVVVGAFEDLFRYFYKAYRENQKQSSGKKNESEGYGESEGAKG